jgi:3',5'-cyclic-nucleotide phosphodiesterase
MTRGLSVAEQARIDHVFISHAHLDHIRDLALAADNIIGVRASPVDIHCTEPTAAALENHIFNNVIWPDFTKIPNPADPEKRPTLQIQRFESGATVEAGAYEVRTVAVNHPVDCQALFVTGAAGTLVYSGDTGPTDELFDALNELDDLLAFIYEVSFPNSMEELAGVSGHLTPQMLAAELEKLDPSNDAPILLYHLKPGFHDQLKAEVSQLADSRLQILKPMDEFEF